MPLRLRLLLSVVAFAAYALAFLPVYRRIGNPTAALTILPVLTTGALLGRTAGALTFFVIAPLNALLFGLVASFEDTLPTHVVASLAFALAGAVVGRLRDMRLALDARQASLEIALRHETETSIALKDREMQLALAQEASRTGSYVVDLATGEVSWSAELYRIFGVEPCLKPSYERFLQHVHPEDRDAVQQTVDRTLRERGASEMEHRVVRADGQVRWVHSSGKVLMDGSGQPIKMVGTCRDVSEHKQMQAKLVVAERMASLGTLAGGVAHEINNPLSYVLSNLRFVSGELADPDFLPPGERLAEAKQVLGEAIQGADRVRRIVEDLRVFARPREQVGPVDVRRVFELAIKIAAGQIRHRARLVKDYADLPPVQADESRLSQVVLNLLVNAAQAIPEGRPSENEIRLVTRRHAADRVAIEVSDTGCGIPPELKDRIFEPFFTTKQVGVGTGLGLSICHGIVRSMGGEITVESEMGKGSTFRVLLPITHHASPDQVTREAA
jgi:PAS domain S-box-containing protein